MPLRHSWSRFVKTVIAGLCKTHVWPRGRKREESGRQPVGLLAKTQQVLDAGDVGQRPCWPQLDGPALQGRGAVGIRGVRWGSAAPARSPSLKTA